MSCVIAANPDAAGIGVRVAVYVQAFVPTITLLINSLSGRLFNDAAFGELIHTAHSTVPPLLTGMALVVSAIIQQHTYGLSVFDALIVLNLCWITVVTGLAPLTLPTLNEDSEPRRSSIPSRPVLSSLFSLPEDVGISNILGLVVLKMLLMGGFGIWVFTTINTFDRSPDACTSSTVVWILGHDIHATSSHFRHLMLALYSITLIPLFNMIIIVIALAPFTMCFTVLLLPYLMIQANKDDEGAIWAIFSPVITLAYNALNAMLIVLTEMMIHSNNISSEEQQWGLGQTCALMVALFSVTGIVSELWAMVRSKRKKGDGLENAGGVTDVGGDLERVSNTQKQDSQSDEGKRRVQPEEDHDHRRKPLPGLPAITGDLDYMDGRSLALDPDDPLDPNLPQRRRRPQTK